ncbi:MAG: hypothetical protein LV479_02175 [Methylacidiphilales bacterium]|nr:hypothetical protein [Candidatus Methylacidiphilales bacterium]
MRTTVDLDDELFRQAKAQAALKGIRFRDLVESAIRQSLRQKGTSRKKVVKLPLWGDKKAGTIKVPNDIVHRMDESEDRERYEASLRH